MPIASRRSLLGLALLLTACARGDRHDSAEVASAGEVTLGPGDVRITSNDGAIDMMLVGNQIIVGLSDSAMHKVRSKTDTSALAGQRGVSASFEKFVKSQVQSVLAKRVSYPLRDLEDANYDNGAIEFDYRGDARFTLIESTKVDEQPLLQSFPDSAARRFVVAVKKRLSSTSA